MAVLAPLVLLDLDVYSVASRKSTSTTTTDTELATDSQKMERFPKTSQTDRCLWSVLPLSSGVAESGVWRLEVGDRENACKATKLHQHRLGTLAAIKKNNRFPWHWLYGYSFAASTLLFANPHYHPSRFKRSNSLVVLKLCCLHYVHRVTRFGVLAGAPVMNVNLFYRAPCFCTLLIHCTAHRYCCFRLHGFSCCCNAHPTPALYTCTDNAHLPLGAFIC